MNDTMRRTTAGEEWLGFACANPQCGLPLLVYEILPEMLDSKGGLRLQARNPSLELSCPSCGNKAVYQTQQIHRIRVARKEQLM